MATPAEDVEEDAIVTDAAAESGLRVLEVHDVARKKDQRACFRSQRRRG